MVFITFFKYILLTDNTLNYLSFHRSEVKICAVHFNTYKPLRLTTQFTHLFNVITTMTHLLLPYTALPR